MCAVFGVGRQVIFLVCMFWYIMDICIVTCTTLFLKVGAQTPHYKFPLRDTIKAYLILYLILSYLLTLKYHCGDHRLQGIKGQGHLPRQDMKRILVLVNDALYR